MTRAEVLKEIGEPFAAMMNGIYADIQKSAKAEKAWRKCLKAGRPPVYHAGYVGMLLLDVVPPEGWAP